VNDRASANARWWGEFRIPHGKAGRWRIGPLCLIVTRLKHEWYVARETGERPTTDCSVELPTEPPAPNQKAIVTRYATARQSELLNVWPVLPDRSIVTRPESPLSVLPRTEVVIYVGSPLWIRLEEEQGDDDKPLADLPAQPAKETWWGPSPRVGELCYATRTVGRIRLDEASRFPHRVLTAVTIKNDAGLPLAIERLNLPVRRLSVYAAKDGRLWTESVTLERAEAEEMAALEVGREPPKVARDAELISRARDSDRTNVLFRAFGTLFS